MIVVTGGTGFIGSNLVAGLEDRGETDLVICDRLVQAGKCRNISKRELVALVLPEQLHEFLERNSVRIRAIFHMGAISSTTETDVDLIIETNVHLSADLWRWCTQNGVPFIYASSAATYGDGSIGFDDEGSVEGLARLRPMNPYGWSKQLFDRMVARWVDEGAPTPPQWVGLKFFNVYGPNEYHKGSMQSLVSKAFPVAAAGDPVTLFRSHDPNPDGGQISRRRADAGFCLRSGLRSGDALAARPPRHLRAFQSRHGPGAHVPGSDGEHVRRNGDGARIQLDRYAGRDPGSLPVLHASRNGAPEGGRLSRGVHVRRGRGGSVREALLGHGRPLPLTDRTRPFRGHTPLGDLRGTYPQLSGLTHQANVFRKTGEAFLDRFTGAIRLIELDVTLREIDVSGRIVRG